MPPTTRARHTRTAPEAPSPLERKVYVLRPEWLETLAGDDERFRSRLDGKPSPTKIAVAAGLDRSHLTQVNNGALGLGLTALAALVNFLNVYRGLTRTQAEAALLELVTQAEAAARRERAVAA